LKYQNHDKEGAVKMSTNIQTIKFPNGDVYTGEVKDGIPHGKGKSVYPGGSSYEGDFALINGTLLNGNGIFTHPNGAWNKGIFKNGDFVSGTVRMIRADGSLGYECGWANGKHNGYGKAVMADGTVHEGEFKDGKFVGKVETSPNVSASAHNTATKDSNKINGLDWTFTRRWWIAEEGKTSNGFSITDDGNTLVVRNDFFEIAWAQTVLSLDPSSNYTFYVDAKVDNYDRHPDSTAKHPNTPGGACVAYQSADGDKLIEFVTPTKNNTPEWKTLSWTVKTNAGTDYTVNLCNGYYQASDKGTAYFKNFRYEKVSSDK